jgi:hypothetical protein
VWGILLQRLAQGRLEFTDILLAGEVAAWELAFRP